MDIKAWLSQYRSADRYARKCAELAEDARQTLRSPNFDRVPRRSLPFNLDYTMEKLEIQEEKLTRAKEKALALLAEIEDAIDQLEDYDQKQVLRDRWISGMSWQDIAEDCYLSERSVYYIHQKALAELEKIGAGAC